MNSGNTVVELYEYFSPLDDREEMELTAQERIFTLCCNTEVTDEHYQNHGTCHNKDCHLYLQNTRFDCETVYKR